MVYTQIQMIEKFEKLTKQEKIVVLFEAISIMQQYNGRGRWDCIFIAMGYECISSNNWKKQK